MLMETKVSMDKPAFPPEVFGSSFSGSDCGAVIPPPPPVAPYCYIPSPPQPECPSAKTGAGLKRPFFLNESRPAKLPPACFTSPPCMAGVSERAPVNETDWSYCANFPRQLPFSKPFTNRHSWMPPGHEIQDKQLHNRCPPVSSPPATHTGLSPSVKNSSSPYSSYQTSVLSQPTTPSTASAYPTQNFVKTNGSNVAADSSQRGSDAQEHDSVSEISTTSSSFTPTQKPLDTSLCLTTAVCSVPDTPIDHILSRRVSGPNLECGDTTSNNTVTAPEAPPSVEQSLSFGPHSNSAATKPVSCPDASITDGVLSDITARMKKRCRALREFGRTAAASSEIVDPPLEKPERPAKKRAVADNIIQRIRTRQQVLQASALTALHSEPVEATVSEITNCSPPDLARESCASQGAKTEAVSPEETHETPATSVGESSCTSPSVVPEKLTGEETSHIEHDKRSSNITSARNKTADKPPSTRRSRRRASSCEFPLNAGVPASPAFAAADADDSKMMIAEEKEDIDKKMEIENEFISVSAPFLNSSEVGPLLQVQNVDAFAAGMDNHQEFSSESTTVKEPKNPEELPAVAVETEVDISSTPGDLHQMASDSTANVESQFQNATSEVAAPVVHKLTLLPDRRRSKRTSRNLTEMHNAWTLANYLLPPPNWKPTNSNSSIVNVPHETLEFSELPKELLESAFNPRAIEISRDKRGAVLTEIANILERENLPELPADFGEGVTKDEIEFELNSVEQYIDADSKKLDAFRTQTLLHLSRKLETADAQTRAQIKSLAESGDACNGVTSEVVTILDSIGTFGDSIFLSASQTGSPLCCARCVSVNTPGCSDCASLLRARNRKLRKTCTLESLKVAPVSKIKGILFDRAKPAWSVSVQLPLKRKATRYFQLADLALSTLHRAHEKAKYFLRLQLHRFADCSPVFCSPVGFDHLSILKVGENDKKRRSKTASNSSSQDNTASDDKIGLGNFPSTGRFSVIGSLLQDRPPVHKFAVCIHDFGPMTAVEESFLIKKAFVQIVVSRQRTGFSLEGNSTCSMRSLEDTVARQRERTRKVKLSDTEKLSWLAYCSAKTAPTSDCSWAEGQKLSGGFLAEVTAALTDDVSKEKSRASTRKGRVRIAQDSSRAERINGRFSGSQSGDGEYSGCRSKEETEAGLSWLISRNVLWHEHLMAWVAVWWTNGQMRSKHFHCETNSDQEFTSRAASKSAAEMFLLSLAGCYDNYLDLIEPADGSAVTISSLLSDQSLNDEIPSGSSFTGMRVVLFDKLSSALDYADKVSLLSSVLMGESSLWSTDLGSVESTISKMIKRKSDSIFHSI